MRLERLKEMNEDPFVLADKELVSFSDLLFSDAQYMDIADLMVHEISDTIYNVHSPEFLRIT